MWVLVQILSNTTISGNVANKLKHMPFKVLSVILKSNPKLIFTADACSSLVYRSYVTATGHWINKNLNFRDVILLFCRYTTKYAGNKRFELLTDLFDLFEDWALKKNTKGIASDNSFKLAFDISKIRTKLRHVLQPIFHRAEIFYMQFLAHVVSLVVKNFLSLAQILVDRVHFTVS